MNVILCIKPQYADAIMGEGKRFEFRRSLFRDRDVLRARASCLFGGYARVLG